jgi:hypothetical protein
MKTPGQGPLAFDAKIPRSADLTVLEASAMFF